MEEAEWLACEDPLAMLNFARYWGTDRTMRLFACACVRRLWALLGPAEREAVEAAERAADGLLGEHELRCAYASVSREPGGGQDLRLAAQAAAQFSPWPGALRVVKTARRSGEDVARCRLLRCIF